MGSFLIILITILSVVVMRDVFNVSSLWIYIVVVSPLLLLGGLIWIEEEIGKKEQRGLRRLQRIRRAREQMEQEPVDHEDLDAIQILPPDTEEGDNLVLYLRPFEMDQIRQFRNPRLDTIMTALIPFYSAIISNEVTFDEALRWLLRGRYEVIALGEQDEALGATRWTVDDMDWKSSFESLASHAQMIMVLPNMRPASQWEIEQICGAPHLLRKTVFLGLLLDKEDLNVDTEVKTARQLLASMGCHLPEDFGLYEAALFDEAGALKKRVQLLKSGILQMKVLPNPLLQLSRQLEPLPFRIGDEEGIRQMLEEDSP